MRNLFYLFIYFLLLNSCGVNRNENLVRISGQFETQAGNRIVIEELDIHKTIPLDSIHSSDQGSFKFELEISDPGFYFLHDKNDNHVLLLLDKGEDAVISSPIEKFGMDYHVEGSPGSVLLKDFEMFMIKQKHHVDSIANLFYAYQYADDFLEIKLQLDSAYLDILEKQRNYVEDFINNHAGSLASLIVLNRKLGNNPVLDEEKDFIYFHRTDSALMISHPGNKHVKDHHERVKQIRFRIFDKENAEKKLAVGKKAPNIVLKDTLGDFISLKDLNPNKVLIYFWAGWNAKSRLDNKKLKEIYPKLKENNFEILGVSMDENEVIWKSAINLDQLPWKNGSELSGVNSKVEKNYHLEGKLPMYYIVDENRKILFKHKDLDEVVIKLEELF